MPGRWKSLQRTDLEIISITPLGTAVQNVSSGQDNCKTRLNLSESFNIVHERSNEYCDSSFTSIASLLRRLYLCVRLRRVSSWLLQETGTRTWLQTADQLISKLSILN
eukprot:TRINITY_DN876_c0_g1_i5.p1 TRINITY_DN876_c0_g1~~TRINITY_DN876_c0_g1_i5.p1  ORF type:complete len:108 (-),score=11.47 TRINITY_DN876_c0_g1_i5:718-1041(-)